MSKRKARKNLSLQDEVATLKQRISAETPTAGSVPYRKNAVVAFRSLPLSQATLQGLESNAYTTMTPIQAASIPHSLAGRDILGAGKTGSGKTLSFLVPMLESLFRKGWSPHDGTGAIVLSPTRELAGQTFAVLRRVGRFHRFSVGLLIGGQNSSRHTEQTSDFQIEQQSLPTTNILVCTPGRLLQHLEQTPYFNVDALQMLVLDEADRVLDLGFRDQLLRILEYLPIQRQTLLFSATQTKDVKHLATLSINRATMEYVGVQDEDDFVTPDRLKQSYVLVPVEHKLNCVYSFLKTHLKQKTIVFMASCSQIRHAWDLFCRLRPGLSVLAIHGKLSQTKRMQVFDKFSNTPHSVLFATDVASRGLDFPNVDWVIQVDAPEDADMYIHRVGRTARFRKQGQALLLLDPCEENCVNQWSMKTPLQKKNVNPSRTVLVTQRAASLVAEHTSLHKLAKKAFLSYTRSLALLPKGSWSELQLREMNLQAYATSLGLATMPSLEFLGHVTNREDKRQKKNINRKLLKLKEQIKEDKEKRKKKRERDVSKRESLDSEDEDFLVVKSQVQVDNSETQKSHSQIANADLLPLPKKIRIDKSKSTKYDDDGNAKTSILQASVKVTTAINKEELERDNKSFMEKVLVRLEQTRDIDRAEERERIRAKHKKKRLDERGDLGEEANARPTILPLESLKNEDTDKSNDTSGDDSSMSTSNGTGDPDDNYDVGKHENLALALIRGRT